MQISSIRIFNFRSLKNIEITDLNKVNIFMGKNNSGKSSILHALYFAKYKNDPYMSPFEDCVFLHKEDEVIEIQLETIMEGKKLLNSTYWRHDGGITKSNEEFPIDDIYYIMSDRGIFFRESNISGGKNSDVGLHGEHTNRNMVYIKQNEESKFSKIRSFAEEIGIGIKNIDNLLLNERNSQVTFVDSQNDLKFNIILGGFGQNQLLPVIVQAFDAPPESVLLFEEPEISLHPGAQRNLIEKFANFVIEENKQILLTSHSSYFLDTIKRWNDSKNKLLEHIALFNISRDDGVTSITKVQPEEIDRTFADFYQR